MLDNIFSLHISLSFCICLLLLSGCGGSEGNTSSSSSSTSSSSSSASSSSSGTATLFDLPVRWRTNFSDGNGNNLNPNNISGYQLAYKKTSALNFETVEIGNQTYTVLEDIDAGNWQIKVAAYDGNGGLGNYSETIEVTVGNSDTNPTTSSYQYSGQEVFVSTANELEQAVANANSNGGSVQIILSDGTYTISDTLYVNADDVVLRSQSGNRELVIIEGDEMSSSANVGNLIRVAGENFILDGITLQKARYHLIQFAGEDGGTSPIVRNCVLQDSFEQLIKITGNDNNIVTSNDGLIENCLFRYTAGIGPQFYIGGIDAHHAKNWTVRNNVFRDIASPSQFVAEHAVHFWDGSADNIVENNIIIDCDRGVGFGLRQSGNLSNTGGIIRNNFVYHSGKANHTFADVGIALDESSDSLVYNNTVILKSGFSWNIEIRFPESTGNQVFNNLTNGTILERSGATATINNNITDIDDDIFTALEDGDLHLNAAVIGIVDAGTNVADLSDLDGEPRVNNDIGADEFSM